METSEKFGSVLRFANENNGAITALATVALTIITGRLVLVGYVQFRTTRAQLRAYVFAGECAIGKDTEGNPVAIVKIINTGQTPGYRMTVATSAKTFWEQEIRRFDTPKNAINSSEGALGSKTHAENEIALREILNENGLTALKSGNIELYVWGTIRYRDVFQRWQTNRPSRGSIGN